MKLAVIGSRKWPESMKLFIDSVVLSEVIRAVKEKRIVLESEVTILSGGAEGVDTFAEEIADYYEFNKHIFYPSDKYEYPVNLFIRNEEIVKNADKIFIFMIPGGSPGSMHAFRVAKLMKKPVEIYYCPY